jgi:hypothetical protein
VPPVDGISIIVVDVVGFVLITAEVVIISICTCPIVVIACRIVVQRVDSPTRWEVAGRVVVPGCISGGGIHMVVDILQPVLILVLNKR